MADTTKLLADALRWREQFEPREGEDSNERFERIGKAFYRDTGYLRPGKDCRVNSMEERQEAWDEWMEAGRSAARAALAAYDAAQAQPAAAPASEPLVRFCPGCGSVGNVESQYRDCCPDGSHARMIPESLAHRCRDLFKLAIDGAMRTAQPASDVHEAVVPTPPAVQPLSEEEIFAGTAAERDALLDHIYEYGTTAEGVGRLMLALVRKGIKLADAAASSTTEGGV